MKRALAVVAVLATASLAGVACAHRHEPTAKPFTGPDGRSSFVVDCKAQASFAGCYAKAREACGGDYEEIHRSEDLRTSGTTGKSWYARQLEVSCKLPPVPAPKP